MLTIRNDLVHINLVDITQSFTPWAGSMRRIEREGIGGRFAVGNT